MLASNAYFFHQLTSVLSKLLLRIILAACCYNIVIKKRRKRRKEEYEARSVRKKLIEMVRKKDQD